LAQRAGIPIPERRSPDEGRRSGPSRTDLYDLHQRLAQWYQSNLRGPAGRQALAYVRERGLDEDALVRFGLGYAPDAWDAVKRWGGQHGFSLATLLAAGVLTTREPEDPPERAYDRFRNRLMFPIWDPQGRVIGFSGRLLKPEDRGGKYVNSPETPLFHKSRVLYGLPLARDAIRDRGEAVLCEGQLDVIACHRAGIKYAVAPQGTAFTEAQAKLLKRYADTITLAFDGDSAGVNAAVRSVEVFAPAGLMAKVAVLAPGEDPDSLIRQGGAEALRTRLEQARDFFLYLLDVEMQSQDSQSPAGKARVVDAVLTAVARLPNAVARAEYCEQVASRLGVRSGPVFQRLRTLRSEERRRGHGQELRRESQAPPPAAKPPPFATEDEVAVKAEATLLELALHHPGYARQLLTDLPREYISESAIGRALNEAVGQIGQGEEAAEVVQALAAGIGDGCSPLLSKALLTPEYGPDPEGDRDPRVRRRLDKAYIQCVRRIKERVLTSRMATLRRRQQETHSRQERQALQKQMEELRKAKRELYGWNTED
jgi:DNA primase